MDDCANCEEFVGKYIAWKQYCNDCTLPLCNDCYKNADHTHKFYIGEKIFEIKSKACKSCIIKRENAYQLMVKKNEFIKKDPFFERRTPFIEYDRMNDTFLYTSDTKKCEGLPFHDELLVSTNNILSKIYNDSVKSEKDVPKWKLLELCNDDGIKSLPSYNDDSYNDLFKKMRPIIFPLHYKTTLYPICNEPLYQYVISQFKYLKHCINFKLILKNGQYYYDYCCNTGYIVDKYNGFWLCEKCCIRK
jgi:hypothetical protein